MAAVLLAPTEALSRGFSFDSDRPQPLMPQLAATDRRADAMPREGFRIGGLRLMIRYEDGSELTELPPVYRLPSTPPWFRGMANLHGALVPVFDVAPWLAVAHDESATPMLLVLGHAGDRAGVVIDGLPVRLRVSPADAIDDGAVPPALADCVAATYWTEGADWMDLHTQALLARLEDELAVTGGSR